MGKLIALGKITPARVLVFLVFYLIFLLCGLHWFRTSFKTWAQEKTGFATEVSEIALSDTITNVRDQRLWVQIE